MIYWLPLPTTLINFSVCNSGQIFRAIRSILNGLVAFLTTCNRHRLRCYSNFAWTFLLAFHTNVAVAESISVYIYLCAVINVVGVMTTYWYSWHRYSNVHLAICQMHFGFPILNQCDFFLNKMFAASTMRR